MLSGESTGGLIGMGFSMVTSHGVTYLTSELLEELQGLKHAFSTRVGGVSPEPFSTMNLGFNSGDDRAHVQTNWRRLTTAAGIAGRPIVYLTQVHSDRVFQVDEAPAGDFRCAGEADALLTSRKGILLSVITADCIPLLVGAGSPVRGAAAIHAGWRGIVSGVVPKTLEKLAALTNVDPGSGDFWVAVGPHIRSCCFEVGPEVVEQFRHAGILDVADFRPTPTGRSLLDLTGILVRQLLAFGVNTDRIDLVRYCTKCRPDLFYSYRRDGSGRGMLGSVIGIEP